MTRQKDTPVASATRPARTPLAQRNRLFIKNKEAGFQYRIVNDTDDRVELMKEAGWEIVPDAKVGATGDKRVDGASSLGSVAYISVGQGTKAVVMRIPDEWYQEDQRAKQAQVDEVESTMRRTAKSNADYGEFVVK